ncbi:MAG: RloB domain-containing protein [Myxococcales bacterium]|nr:RloB domain-containing protein [Myxococcales bacterium]
MATHRHAPRRPARATAARQPRQRLLVVCEGRVTEPEYLDGLRSHLRNPLVTIEVVPGAGVPLTLVKSAKSRKLEAIDRAKREKDDNLLFDQVWCVFDVDDHPHIPDAAQMARDNGIYIAISNPCFELWLLLHVREPPGMQPRKEVARMLKRHLPDYDKHLKPQRLLTGIEDAVLRAERLDLRAEDAGSPGCNPTTGVYRLVRALRG